jgi:hypothetical protein
VASVSRPPFPSPLIGLFKWLRAGPWWRWLLPIAFLGILTVSAYLGRGWTGLTSLGLGLLAIIVLDAVVTAPERLRGLAQTTLPVYVWLLTLFVAPEHVASTEFYKAMAQVLPVLLLAFVVEKRAEFHDATHLAQRLSRVMVVIYLLSASYETFSVLAVDDAARGDAGVVIAAMTATIAALTLSMLAPPHSTPSKSDDQGTAS